MSTIIIDQLNESIWALGLCAILYVIVIVARLVYYQFIYSNGNRLIEVLSKRADNRINDNWALITGASYGLGKSYATALSRRKFNVILLARSRDKLEQLASHLRANYGVKAVVLDADVTEFESNDQFYEQLLARLDPSIEISVLVNNIGGQEFMVSSDSYKKPTFFLDEKWREEEQTRLINLVPTQRFTKLLLPKMLSRGRGVVINISSLGASFGVHFPMYIAVKAAINALTLALEDEYGGKGVIFQGVLAGAIATPALSGIKPNLLVVHPDRLANNSIAALGGPTLIAPYWVHAMSLIVCDLLPRRLVRAMVLRETEKLLAKRDASARFKDD